MPAIISGKDLRELIAYRSTGLTPDEIEELKRQNKYEQEEAAPLPIDLWGERQYSGLIEE